MSDILTTPLSWIAPPEPVETTVDQEIWLNVEWSDNKDDYFNLSDPNGIDDLKNTIAAAAAEGATVVKATVTIDEA